MNNHNRYSKSNGRLDLKSIYEDLYVGYFHSMCSGTKYSSLGALICLLEMCAHADQYQLGSDCIYLPKGSVRISLGELANAMRWSKKKAFTFLEELQRLDIIDYKSDKTGTFITLNNLGNEPVDLDS